MTEPAIIVVGGLRDAAGTTGPAEPAVDARVQGGLGRAKDAGAARLAGGSSALLSALEAAAILEDDPLFNAGTGANVRGDGVSIEMDAAIMTSDGRFMAVTALRRMRHPLLVAAAIGDNVPTGVLAGDVAFSFAEARGFTPYDPSTPEARARLAAARRAVAAHHPEWQLVRADHALLAEPMAADDGIAVLTRDAQGGFAAVASTGGALGLAAGSVTQLVVPGCAIYAGPKGAAVCGGDGGELVRRSLARATYELLARDIEAQDACDRILKQCRPECAVGVTALGLSSRGIATAAAQRWSFSGV